MTHIKRYLSVLLVGVFIFVFQIIGAWQSGSAALLGDSMHVLQDNAQIILALVIECAVLYKWTADSEQARLIGAHMQLVALFLLGGWLIFEGASRMLSPEPVDGGTMLVFAVVGALLNWWQHRHLHGIDNVNAEGLRLHILSDLIQSIAVVIGAGIIALTGWMQIDGLLTLAIGGAILYWCYNFQRRINNQNSPKEDVKQDGACGCDHHNH